ncbi:MAG: TrkA family potassium uptake protein [Phycisphaerales bacterium]|nr:MAG: TrkA family potassium uptake protein [Phycisphaerales bacterium]
MNGPVVVVGLGQFGTPLAKSLASRGVEVVAFDRRRDLVESVRDDVTLAVALDATDEEAVKANLPSNTRVAVVGIGSSFEAQLLVTVLLKQLGVKRVVSRATSPLEARILRKIGADEVVSPEEESAERWANRISAPQLLNQIEFHEGYSLVEIKTPRDWIGKTLIDLDLRSKFKLHVVAVKSLRKDRHPAPAEHASDATPSNADAKIEMPKANEPLREDDILILMGKDEDIAKVPMDRH